VQVLGFKEVLPVGGVVTKSAVAAKPEEPLASEEITSPVEKASEATETTTPEETETTQSPEETTEEVRKLKLVIKADVAGMLEAIKANLTEEVELVGEGVGDVSDSDICWLSLLGQDNWI
jgi:translation initiation factor IF-2